MLKLLNTYFLKTKALTYSIFSILCVSTGNVIAYQLPDSEDIVPDGVSTDAKNTWDFLMDFVILMLQGIAVLIAAVVTLGYAWHLFQSFAEAKKTKDGWPGFIATAFAGAFVTVFAIALAIAAVSYL